MYDSSATLIPATLISSSEISNEDSTDGSNTHQMSDVNNAGSSRPGLIGRGKRLTVVQGGVKKLFNKCQQLANQAVGK
ncbi:hypothetical protein FRC07_003860 [Ceratobasidium sp. 392]|nr:hypothetical protein FRC07_003860 [Ceratobasidium sp. 392]